MQLVAMEAALRLDVAGLLVHRNDAVVDGPVGRGAVVGRDPLVQVLAVEEHDGVRGGRAVVARRHDLRFRAPDLRVLGLGFGGFLRPQGSWREENEARNEGGVSNAHGAAFWNPAGRLSRTAALGAREGTPYRSKPVFNP